MHVFIIDEHVEDFVELDVKLHLKSRPLQYGMR